MNRKTVSELLFEQFCSSNRLTFERIPEGVEPTPDYRVDLRTGPVIVEVKQIDKDPSFKASLMLRTPASHVRAKIDEARDQVRESPRFCWSTTT